VALAEGVAVVAFGDGAGDAAEAGVAEDVGEGLSQATRRIAAKRARKLVCMTANDSG
jgi:hypothetical protein